MAKKLPHTPPYWDAGQRVKQLREAKGISRREFAAQLNVDISSVFGWETGRRLPREKLRAQIANILGSDTDLLFSCNRDGSEPTIAARNIDTVKELPELLLSLTRQTRQRLRALRLAAPYGTTAHQQTGWRNLVSERLLNGTLEVERVEIFYDLRRVQEVISNIFRYENCRYYIKAYCTGIVEVVPAFGGYFFDDDEFLLGAYWQTVPPDGQSGIRVSGAPFRKFFKDYWSEIWRRGTWLNPRGPYDLSALREIAGKLGLAAEAWHSFVEEAKALTIGDGAPPLI